MILTNAKIEGYKSISDFIELIVEKDITCLIGKSEVGKTNIKKAIEMSFNDDGLEETEINNNYVNVNEYYLSELTFDLNERERDEITKRYNISFDRIVLKKKMSGDLEVSFNGENDMTSRLAFDDDFLYYTRNIRSRLRKLNTQLKDLILYIKEGEFTEKDDDELEFSLDKMRNYIKIINNYEKEIKGYYSNSSESVVEEAQSKVNDFFEKLQEIYVLVAEYEGTANIKNRLSRLKSTFETYSDFGITKEMSMSNGLKELLKSVLPSIVNVVDENYYNIREKIDYKEFMEDPDSFPFYKNLFDLAETKPDSISIDNVVRRTMLSKQINGNINEKLRKVWNQEEIKIDLSFQDGEMILLIAGEENYFAPPSVRSEGFRWFLSFMIRNLEYLNKKNNLIIMDEPGIRLHASGQKDLLKIFYDLSKDNQIIYTTHSPYLIPKSFPYKIRIVKKEGENGKKATTIDNIPYHSAVGRAWEPVRSAIGAEVGDILSFGANNILVEGITDQILISSVCVFENRKSNDKMYDLDNTNIISFNSNKRQCLSIINIINSNDYEYVVVVDNDTGGSDIKKHLRSNGIEESRIVVIGKKGDEIEDVFGTEEYYKEVVEFYNEEDVKLADNLKDAKSEICEELEIKEEQLEKKGTTKIIEQYIADCKGLLFSKTAIAKQIADKIKSTDYDDNSFVNKAFKTLVNKVFDKVNGKIGSH